MGGAWVQVLGAGGQQSHLGIITNPFQTHSLLPSAKLSAPKMVRIQDHHIVGLSLTYLGVAVDSNFDVFLKKSQTAFDPPPPLTFEIFFVSVR